MPEVALETSTGHRSFSFLGLVRNLENSNSGLSFSAKGNGLGTRADTRTGNVSKAGRVDLLKW